MNPTIELQTLGTVGIRTSDGGISTATVVQPKRLAILAYLALAPRRRLRRRNQVVALFWPELDEARARGALSQALRYLRRALGDGVILTQGEDEAGVDQSKLPCDAVTLAAAVEIGDYETAAATYRGAFFEGFHVGGLSHEFEEWVASERERALQGAITAIGALSKQAEQVGDATRAVILARRATQIAPDDEGPVRALISLLTRVGDPTAAVREFERFASSLEKRLGLSPSPGLSETIGKLRNN